MYNTDIITKVQNMKIIHCADIHLGSPMSSISDDEKRKERQSELRATFSRMASFAAAEGISAIIIAGDLFDRDRPFRRDRDFFLSTVKANPGVDFLYLRGNHDMDGVCEDFPANLKPFGSSWVSYSYGNINISGVELNVSNCSSVYSTYVADSEKYNIAVMHGQLCDKAGVCEIDRRRLSGRGIDYLALGHYHGYTEQALDSRCTAVYSGCPEGRGWDEPGDCGFVLIETSDSGISHKFIPFARRRFVIRRIDVSGCLDIHEVLGRINAAAEDDSLASPAGSDDMLRAELSGSPEFDTRNLSYETESLLRESFWNVNVKDLTKPPLILGDYENDLSLRGEFIRNVMKDTSYSDGERRRVIMAGLQALEGEEVEI